MKKILVTICIVVLLIAAYVMLASSGASSASEAADAAWREAETAYAPRLERMRGLAGNLSGEPFMPIASYVTEFNAALDGYESAGTPDARVRAAGEIESSYTALQFALESMSSGAARSVQGLIADIAATEAGVSAARASYNAAIREYNRQAGRLPGQEARAYFQSADGI